MVVRYRQHNLVSRSGHLLTTKDKRPVDFAPVTSSAEWTAFRGHHQPRPPHRRASYDERRCKTPLDARSSRAAGDAYWGAQFFSSEPFAVYLVTDDQYSQP